VFDGFHYVATTSTIDQKIIAYVATSASSPGFSSPNSDAGGQQWSDW